MGFQRLLLLGLSMVLAGVAGPAIAQGIDEAIYARTHKAAAEQVPAAPSKTPTPSPGTVSPSPDAGVSMLRAVLWTTDDRLDLAHAKITLDHFLDPTVDETETNKLLNVWVDRVRRRMPPNASTWTKVLVLSDTLYRVSAWNGNRKMDYAFDDPFGKDLKTSELSHYLQTQRGNCVSMPILFAILAQRIGLNATLATAPNHLLVKIKLDNGDWFNYEATSGSTLTKEQYETQFHIDPRAVEMGTYLRPLTRREAILAITGPLIDYYNNSRSPSQMMALAQLELSYQPDFLNALMLKGSAYDKQVSLQYRQKYASPSLLTPWQLVDYQALMKNYFAIGDKLTSLGWHRRTTEQDREYQQTIAHAKAADKPTGG
jgi:regulator of sirC expression with transglutaminase-like and TPR domain